MDPDPAPLPEPKGKLDLTKFAARKMIWDMQFANHCALCDQFERLGYVENPEFVDKSFDSVIVKLDELLNTKPQTRKEIILLAQLLLHEFINEDEDRLLVGISTLLQSLENYMNQFSELEMNIAF